MTRYLLVFDSYGPVFVGLLSDERTGLSFVYAFASVVFLGTENIFYSIVETCLQRRFLGTVSTLPLLRYWVVTEQCLVIHVTISLVSNYKSLYDKSDRFYDDNTPNR
jgi:hypothetical protein